MKLGRTRKRALSTVVSSAILMSSVALIGTMMVGWSNSTFATQQQELSSAFDSSVNKLNEFIVIENIWFGNNPAKHLNVTISNPGTIGVNVTQINVADSTNSIQNIITDGGIITKKHISKNVTFAWTSSDLIDVTVITSSGSVYKTQVLPP